MENLNLRLLKGGFDKCEQYWNMKFSNGEKCYKIYFITDGYAETVINGVKHKLEKGNIYYMDTHKLEENICPDYIDMFWVHFIPDSLYLNMHIIKLKDFESWRLDDPAFLDFNLQCIPDFFEGDHGIDVACSIQSILLKFLSKMLSDQKDKLSSLPYSKYLQLLPAIEYMDDKYITNLSLKEIAEKIFLSPEYFLRLFKKSFNITPHQYILHKRLNESCSLLTRTSLSIEEISSSVGFCNQFYYSKMFKAHFNITPNNYRKSKLMP